MTSLYVLARFECLFVTLLWTSCIIRKRRLFELGTYFLSRKYKVLLRFSHLTKEILLWYRSSLRRASKIRDSKVSRASIWFHNVWVNISAGSLSSAEMSWFNWSFESSISTFGSSIFRFIRAKVIGCEGWNGDRCSWIGFRVTVLHCRSRILEFKTWDFSTVWCWYRCRGFCVFFFLGRSSDRRVKASGLPPALFGQYVI